MLLAVSVQLEADSGTLVTENGTDILEVQPGQSLGVTASATASPGVQSLAFQLNLSNSDIAPGQLVLSDWAANSSVWASVGQLDTPNNSILVGGARSDFTTTPIGSSPVDLGSFTMTAPTAAGEYLLTVNGGSGGTVTIVDVGGGSDDTPDFDDYGDLIVRVDNFAPQVLGESYTLDQLTTLSVDVNSGVLANDSDQNADMLSVSLVTDVQSGQLTLNDDGSFDYQPEDNFHGTDSFTYQVSDGTATATATATLNVIAATPWRNPTDAIDVNNDGSVKPQDVLILINFINSRGGSVDLPSVGGELGSPPPFYDVNGDNRVTIRDVLVAINEINRREADASGELADGELADGEGELVADGANAVGGPRLNQPIEPGILPVPEVAGQIDSGTAADPDDEVLLDVLAVDLLENS